MKKIFTMVLAAVMAMALAACGASDTVQQTASASRNEDKAMAATIPGGIQGKKVLVAYYSWSGHTKAVAEQIARETGGELFAIQPVKAYPTDYRECTQIAKQEAAENARPAVANAVDNMDQYDVIFIGYPIWYGKAPMVVHTFLESDSLNGKTIVPICTSGGSPLSGSIPDIQASAKGAQLVRGSQSTDAAAISQWLKTIQAVP